MISRFLPNLSLDLFFWTLLSLFTYGLTAIILKIWLPAELEFEQVMEGFWDEKLDAYFKRHDRLLEPLGYRPSLTYKIINLQSSNITRNYLNPMDSAIISVNAIGGLRGQKYTGQNYVAVTTHYADEYLLTTRNVNITSVLDRPARSLIQDFKGLDDLPRLKELHDLEAEKNKYRGVIRFQEGDWDRYMDSYRKYHLEFCKLNESEGLIRYDEKNNKYRATYKTALRGIANYLNPLADNFTWRRFLLALLLGFAIPLAGSYCFPKILPFLMGLTEYPRSMTAYLYLGLVYGIAGFSIGSIFKEKSFIWGFLMGYLPCRLLSGLFPGWFMADLWLAFVADEVSKFKKKKEKVI